MADAEQAEAPLHQATRRSSTARRNSLQVTSAQASEAAAESDVCYAQQLENKQKLMAEHAAAAEEKLLAVLNTHVTSELDSSTAQGSVRGVLEWLARALRETTDELSSSHRSTARNALKAQAVVFEMKLATTRTAASVEKQAQAVEMEAAMAKKIEESVKAVQGEGGDAHRKALEELTELKAKVLALKLKNEGTEAALTVAQSRLRAKDVSVAQWKEQTEEALAQAAEQLAVSEAQQAEAERCRELLDGALVDLALQTSVSATLEDKVRDLVSELERCHTESEGMRSQLSCAMADLGIALDENVSLSEQLKAVVAQAGKAHEAESAAAELTAALETREREDCEAAKEREVLLEAAAQLQAKLEAARAEAAEARAEAEVARAETKEAQQAMEDEREAAARSAAALAAELDEARASARQATHERDQRAKEAEGLRGEVCGARCALESACKRLHLPLPENDAERTVVMLASALATACATSAEELRKAVDEMREMERRMAPLEAECVTRRQEADTLREQCAQVEDEVAAATKQLARWTAVRAALRRWG
jgi:hypothetical protein